MPGYSGTPLPKKLGIKPGFRVALDEVPPEVKAELKAALADCELVSGAQEADRLPDGLHKIETGLGRRLCPPQQATHSGWNVLGGLAKKSSGVATDLNENIVREIGLAAGLVDVKVCAVTEVWSGLKFVRRVKDR